MKIELQIWSKGTIGAISAANKEMILHPYCAPDKYSNTMRSIGNGLIKSTINRILSTEEQLVISRLITAVESFNEHNLNIIIIDNRSLFTRLKTCYKHRTIDTPFLVIGNQCIQGTPSIEELIKVINCSN